jgi:hypothetical protein
MGRNSPCVGLITRRSRVRIPPRIGPSYHRNNRRPAARSIARREIPSVSVGCLATLPWEMIAVVRASVGRDVSVDRSNADVAAFTPPGAVEFTAVEALLAPSCKGP